MLLLLSLFFLVKRTIEGSCFTSFIQQSEGALLQLQEKENSPDKFISSQVYQQEEISIYWREEQRNQQQEYNIQFLSLKEKLSEESGYFSVLYFNDIHNKCSESQLVLPASLFYSTNQFLNQEVYCISGYIAILFGFESKEFQNNSKMKTLQHETLIFKISFENTINQENQIIKGFIIKDINLSPQNRLGQTQIKVSQIQAIGFLQCMLVDLQQQKNQYKRNLIIGLEQSRSNKRILGLCTDGCNNCVNIGGKLYCADKCKAGFYSKVKPILDYSCLACDPSCVTCSGSGNKACTSCKINQELKSDKSCKDCLIGQGEVYNASTKKCDACSTGCSTCISSTQCTACLSQYELSNNACKACQTSNGEFYNSVTKKCEKCSSNCLTCSNSTQCTLCKVNYELDSSKACTACQLKNGEFYNSGTKKCDKCATNCLICDSLAVCKYCKPTFQVDSSFSCSFCGASCSQCQIFDGQFLDGSNSCQSCYQDCQTCDGLSNNNCLSCRNNLKLSASNVCIDCSLPQLYSDDNITCKSCNINCYMCNGPNSNNCTECAAGQFLNTQTSTCQSNCNTSDGFYENGDNCSPCDSTCNTCTGPSNTECLTCAQNLFQYGNDKLCKKCPDSTQNPTDIAEKLSDCDQTELQCLQNTTTNSFETTEVCILCKNGMLLNKGTCINSCSDITQNYVYNATKKQCECSSSFPFLHIKDDSSIFCSSSQQPGYYCDSNKLCNQCTQINCDTCPDKNTCSLCKSGYYLWQNACLTSCSISLGLEVSSSNTQCQCIKNYVYYKPESKCVLKLKVVSIKLSKNIKYNIITVTFNRIPYSGEFNNASILVDPSKLIQNKDYQVDLKQSIDVNIIFYISVNLNRKINEVIISINNENSNFTLKNTIFTTEEYNKSQQDFQNNIDNLGSTSKSLTPQEGAAKTIINGLKSFQFLCFLSNFVQLLGPLIVFKEFLPQPLYIGTILGASFIFSSIPDSDQLDVASSDQINQSIDTQQQSNQQLLEALGLKSNIYETLLFPHLSLIISVIIILLCLLARWAMKGKQYTISIVNILINTMSSLHQGYITSTLFSIYYSLKYSSLKGYAILQIIVHIVFIILMSAVILKQEIKYIENNIPNFILNLNIKSNGWRSYLILSYIKKYVSILLILLFYSNPKVCGIMIACLFILFSVYLFYFRFFTHWFFTAYKIFQELIIAISMLLFVICVKKQADILEQDSISNDELISVDSFSLMVLIMFAVCLIVSFILFLVRTCIQFYTIIQQIQNYFLKKNNKANVTLDGISLEKLVEKMKTPKDQFNYSEVVSVSSLKSQFTKKKIRSTKDLES